MCWTLWIEQDVGGFLVQGRCWAERSWEGGQVQAHACWLEGQQKWSRWQEQERGQRGGNVRCARCPEVLRLYQLMDLQGSPFSATKGAAGQEGTGCFREEGASKRRCSE